MTNLLEMAGAQPQKQPKYVPLFIDRAFTGIYTQRSVLHDPSDLATQRFYGGRPDALWQGSNIELTNRLTLQRRPGLAPFSTATYSTPPDRSFAFELTNGTIQVIIDTSSTGSLVLSSVAASIGSTAVYTGTFPSGGSNAYVGLVFQIAGFTSGNNNGTFTCSASSTTTLTLSNSLATLETHAATAISAGAIYYDTQSAGVKNLIYAKSPGAGQAYFVAVAGVLYIGDGVDQIKYTPGNANGTTWNWQGSAPAAPPGVVITPSGSVAAAWAASTFFSTMGIIVDSNGNAQQLVSVNADPSNPNSTQFGLSGSGAPRWDLVAIGGTVVDGTVTWKNQGPITSWTANTGFNGIGTGGTVADPATIYDPVSKGFYENSRTGTGFASGGSKPPFTGALGDQHFDGACNWVCYANSATTPQVFKWRKNFGYGTFLTSFGPDNCIVTPFVPPFGVGQVSTLFTASGNGTSQATAYIPVWSTVPGNPTYDGQLKWVCLGSATRQNATQYGAWNSPNNTAFNAVKDPDGNLHVCVQTGVSAGSPQWQSWQSNHVYATLVNIIDTNGYIQSVTTGGISTNGVHPVWNQTVGGTTTDNSVTWTNQGPAYGFHTTDGGVIWVCVGTATNAAWTAAQSYYLPTVGFSAPSSGNPRGGAAILDSNSKVEFVLSSGVSGTPTHPTWNTNTGGLTTTDNTVLWYNNGAQSVNSLSWTKGHVYAYSYYARTLLDSFNLSAPPGWPNPLGTPTGSETGAITTASPVFTITGPNAGAVNTISGVGSTDPQFDTIIIWRDADGGGSDNMFELTEIPAPPPIAGIAQPWSFQDYLPDVPTSVFPGLNNLIPAPINGENNPPPVGFLPMAYNFQRIWGAVGSTVYFSGGPDVVTGNKNEAFNIADSFPYLARVVRLVKTSQGLVTFLVDGVEIIAGGPLTSSFYSVTLAPGIGLSSYNALDVYAGEIYFFSADSQFKTMSPSLQLANSGFPLGDKFAAFNSSAVYVAVHQSGVDSCIMVSDGSTGWYRVNPRQIPGGSNGPEPVWSPFANITNGCKMVQSVQVTPGVKKLLVGGTLANQQVLQRDLSIFTDNGTPYDAFFVMGSITLAHPGQLAVLKFIEADFSGVSYQPTISYLLNEISGSFTPFTAVPQFDPPSLYGATITPSSYSPNRYYFSGTGSLARCRHLQIKVDFGTTSNGDELFNICIFGRIMVEG